MEIYDLIGSKVSVRRRGSPDCAGLLSHVVHSVALENIASSFVASTFRVELESGDSMETTGVNILKIENEAFAEEKAKADPWSSHRRAFKIIASHLRRILPGRFVNSRGIPSLQTARDGQTER